MRPPRARTLSAPMAERILALTCVRDEGPNLIDWVAHLRSLGVGEILVYANDCADGTSDLLDALARGGAVIHVPNVVPPGRTPQWSALRQARTHPAVLEAGWIMAIDVDEYPALAPPLLSLHDLIDAAAADAIVLPWRLFGNAGHIRRPDAPPTAAFTRAIRADALYPALSRFFKTLFRRAAFAAPGVHRPKPAGDSVPRWTDGSGRMLPDAFAHGGQIMLWGGPMAADLVQLNHYSVRSVDDFVAKARRGLPNHTGKPVDLTYWTERNFNEVTDTRIERHAPAAAAEARRLRALPGVAAFEAAARDWHAARLAEALTDPETAKFYGRLALSAGSVSPPEAEARRLVALYQAAVTGT